MAKGPSQMNVDMMDDITLFRINQLTKEKSNLGKPGQSPTLILTDATGKKRLSLANYGQLQEIREQKALIDAESDISVVSVVEGKKEIEDHAEKGKVKPRSKNNTFNYHKLNTLSTECYEIHNLVKLLLCVIFTLLTGDAKAKPKPEYDKQFEGKIKFRNDFHRLMHRFSEANSFSVFMLLVIVANCAILIAMTFEIVVVRGGMCNVFCITVLFKFLCCSSCPVFSLC